MKSIALLTYVMLLATGSANAQTLDAGQQSAAPTAYPVASAASRKVTAAAAAIVDAFGHHDPKKYFSHFAPDATFVFYTTPKRLNTRAEYEVEWATWEKEDGFRVRSCRSSDQRVQILGDVAVFTHSVQTELSTNQGPSTVQERETIVFHRRGGKWVAVHEHLSPLPAPQPPAAK
jgi:ketosteroid isomerase-like protein